MWLWIAVTLIVFCEKTQSTDCGVKKCVQKCCPDKQIVTNMKKCVPFDGEMDFSDDLPVYNDVTIQVGHLKDFFGVEPGAFSNNDFREKSAVRATFSLYENSTVQVYMDKNRTVFVMVEPESYCLDYRLVRNSTVTSVWWYTSEKNASDDFYTYSLLVSSVFLLLVLVVYILLPELRNLGGLVLMCYVGSLLFAYIFLFVIKLHTSFGLDGTSCIAITLLVCFFFTSAFCWMTVMSYDIWWTFRGYAKARPIHRRGERYKFKLYSLFAWGVPLGLMILIAVMNSLDKKKFPKIIVPGIPHTGCFLSGSAHLVYLYVPMLILIISNWLFYLMTAFNIWRLSRGTKVLDTADSSASGTNSARNVNRERFLVYLKLSALMGLSWILEVVSSFYPNLSIWFISDVYNIFLGLIIFIIFVCKKKILKKLKKRFRGPELGHQASTSFTTRSRSTLESNPQSIPLKTLETTSHQP